MYTGARLIAITLYIQGMEGEDTEEEENTTVAISGCDAAAFLTVYSDEPSQERSYFGSRCSANSWKGGYGTGND